MRLLQNYGNGEYHLTERWSDEKSIPPYAILSHTWGADGDEVVFEDLMSGIGQEKPGYDKIRFCGQQAAKDGLKFFWVDSCCIDRSNKAELSHSINSMFRWYRNSVKCYVYLADVSSDTSANFQRSRWFSRGWTLQELLAPSTVEFFTRDQQPLGDRALLKQQIHEATGIPLAALQGTPLTTFSVNDRLSWKESRQTKLEEDMAYCLLGIFGVHVAPIYGEGLSKAFDRLLQEIGKLEKCIQDLRLTDPSDDKKRIEETKGGLLKDSYAWILEDSTFQQWRVGNQRSQMLWIRGDPGKGKTMLLCGIIDEMQKTKPDNRLLAFFFCQATDSRINNATAVLRGLLYMLVTQQPSLISHVRKKHDKAGKALFDDANAWVATVEILTEVLQDPTISGACLAVDALDECVTDLPKLLQFIVQQSASSCIKWIVTSRNWPEIEQRFERAQHLDELSLELNAKSISTAVSIFIRQKVSSLAQDKKYNDQVRQAVLSHLESNANDTFLWVALAYQYLEKIPRWMVVNKLSIFPPGLTALYHQMLHQISISDTADLCKSILAVSTTVYRPLSIQELVPLVTLLEGIEDDLESVREIVGLCGSFLILRDNVIYFVHQSAKDFLIRDAYGDTFATSQEETHWNIFKSSLRLLEKTLHRDMYNLQRLGFLAEDITAPDPDPMAASRYPSIYWAEHLCDSRPDESTSYAVSLQERGAVDGFLRRHYLHWLELLSLCGHIRQGVKSIHRLWSLIQKIASSPTLEALACDALQFIRAHRLAMELAPLQTYASALLFSPEHSLIKACFKKEDPGHIEIKPALNDDWDTSILSLDANHGSASSISFSHDSTKLVVASESLVNIWDIESGACVQIYRHHVEVSTAVLSNNGNTLATGLTDDTLQLWDTTKTWCFRTIEGLIDSSRTSLSVFSPDLARLAVAYDSNIQLWTFCDTGRSLSLRCHHLLFVSMAFSPDSTLLAAISQEGIILLLDTSNCECVKFLPKATGYMSSVAAFAHDLSFSARATRFGVELRDMRRNGDIQSLAHSETVRSIAYSRDSSRLASGSIWGIIKIWDTIKLECVQILSGHGGGISELAFSPTGNILASASDDGSVKLWSTETTLGQVVDQVSQSSYGLGGPQRFGLDDTVSSMTSYSQFLMAVCPDSMLAASSQGNLVKVWAIDSGECLETLGCGGIARKLEFSCDSSFLAVLTDSRLQLWNPNSGNCLQSLGTIAERHKSMIFSKRLPVLVATFSRTAIRIWDAVSGKCLQLLDHITHFDLMEFSPNSNHIAVLSYVKVTLWNASGTISRVLRCHDDDHFRNALAFSHDSTRLASASDASVYVWDVKTGQCLQKIGYDHEPRLLAFAHRKPWLASSLHYDYGPASVVFIWDIRTGMCIQDFQCPKVLREISFDITDSYLDTSFDSIDLKATDEADIIPPMFDYPIARFKGVGLSGDGIWLTYDSEKLVYIPPNYRPCFTQVADKGRTICASVGNGKVWFCTIRDPNDSTSVD